MMNDSDSAQALLDAVYTDLDFEAGTLLDAAHAPGDLPRDVWTRSGGWLSLAHKVGADRVFFVEDNPVIVFVKGEPSRESLRRLYNRAWCMARPPLLFVAQPGVLTVLDLTQPPIRKDEDFDASRHILKAVERAATVQSELAEYRRAQIESGCLFEERRFGYENRADYALIRDLALVRQELLATGLSMPHAHGLIGRSIFIRYLEDRRILTEEYFRKIARGNRRWNQILDNAPAHEDSSDNRHLYYAAVLSDKEFTHALFANLSKDFNGDLFPVDISERKAFTARRLKMMREFLLGAIDGPLLFTFAYDFDIVPIDLISSMYEEFLRAESGTPDAHGSHYTPSTLVDFVLSQSLTDEILARRPRILDPACGSAIFLVEAFRRLVRHRVCEQGRRLRPDELRKILREQIAGIDVQAEAVRVAAFSLYLAMLHYLEPPDILRQRLPNLVWSPNRLEADPNQHFDILVVANAFDVDGVLAEKRLVRRFTSQCADVVVGNPPWGTPSEQDAEARDAASQAMQWCDERKHPVGDRELSQAFVGRTLDLLCEGGRAGLLVSTGVFFKRHENSRRFRRRWLGACVLDSVVNFAVVRDVFFSRAIAPFASVVFERRRPRTTTDRFRYYSAKRTAFVEGQRVVRLDLPDLHVVRQSTFAADDELWKVYWWGGHCDEALLHALRLEDTLGHIVDPEGEHPDRFGEGFKVTRKGRRPVNWPPDFKELPTKHFQRYGAFPSEVLTTPPDKVERARTLGLFRGRRLLVKRGITQRGGADGVVVSRLESTPFCFRHSIQCFGLQHLDETRSKLVLAIMWSSLARYYLWMTSGSWGMWHHELRIESIRKVPIRFPSDHGLMTCILGLVDRLRSFDTTTKNIFGTTETRAGRQIDNAIRVLEGQLDDAIFDLYELSEGERDAVRDMCDVGLEFFYRGVKSDAVKRVPLRNARRFGRRNDVPTGRSEQRGLEGYIHAFLRAWDTQLPDGQFCWRVISPSEAPGMLGVVFSTEDSRDPLPAPSDEDDKAWSALLAKLGKTSSHHFGSNRIYIDGMTRIVSENDIVIIKRNERRLWTRTAASEDAEATQLQAIRRQGTAAAGNDA